ncbi:cytochrome P450 [Massariosphaeria phaeospora]|uniref:Cytochrome P450 n=1 Tax=Massariosphaeria phaeospora TaxID=100035 RepID=A0A7C8I164_9PLEO|nr:cytochrome P450 [Massariosphaeria phaeospora]
MGFFYDNPLVAIVASSFLLWLVRFIVSFVKTRQLFHRLPGPPHHLLWGHMMVAGTIASRLPKRVHPHVYPCFLTKEYDLPPLYYLDLYPLNHPTLVILDPQVAQDVLADATLPKHRSLKDVIAPLAGHANMLSSYGPMWKKWRSAFNPGFSVHYLMQQVTTIVDCSEAFVEILDQHATTGRVFRLEEETTKMTIDIIGKAVCDHDFKALVGDSEFQTLMRKTISWMPDTQSLNPFHRKHPFRPLFWKYYKWRLDQYVGKVLDERFTARIGNAEKKARKKTGIDLALEQHFKESGQDVDSRTTTMSTEFRRNAIDNLLVLLFAGHDTTASTVCYCYHMLSKHPEKLAKIREEFNNVFGQDVGAAAKLKQDPFFINKCEYTLAVIKEVLRLWPPGSSGREGRKGYFVKDPITGNMLPTENFLLWVPSIAMHRDPRIWGDDAHEFKPERFLSENNHKLVPNAYRPFEKGPRNCIGQELALLEMKIVLATTVREFDIKAAYDELDTLDNDGSLWARDRSEKTGIQKCFGDEAYQILLAAGKPREGMPARVMLGNVLLGNVALFALARLIEGSRERVSKRRVQTQRHREDEYF